MGYSDCNKTSFYMKLGNPHFIMREQIPKFVALQNYVWTSFRWRWMLMRMPAPMKSVRSAVPP